MALWALLSDAMDRPISSLGNTGIRDCVNIVCYVWGWVAGVGWLGRGVLGYVCVCLGGGGGEGLNPSDGCVDLTVCTLGIFSAFVFVCCLFKNTFFQEHYQSVKRIESTSDVMPPWLFTCIKVRFSGVEAQR